MNLFSAKMPKHLLIVCLHHQRKKNWKSNNWILFFPRVLWHYLKLFFFVVFFFKKKEFWRKKGLLTKFFLREIQWEYFSSLNINKFGFCFKCITNIQSHVTFEDKKLSNDLSKRISKENKEKWTFDNFAGIIRVFVKNWDEKIVC